MQGLPYLVFLTRNSEYHLESHVCVGVRDRRTGCWLPQHPALSRPLAASVCTAGQRALLQAPQLGESLEFDLGGEPLRTSPVLNIERRLRRPLPQTNPRLSLTPPAVRKEEARATRRARWARWAKWPRARRTSSEARTS